MKALTKNNHLLICSILLISTIVIGFLTLKKPDANYSFSNEHSLDKLVSEEYLVELNALNDQSFVICDIRNQYDYERGHLKNAINLSSTKILKEENQILLKELQNSNKAIVLYGSTPEEANLPFMILYQLGYDNIKLLPIELSYIQNELIANQVDVEKSAHDIKSFIAESVKKAKVKTPPIIKTLPAVKSVKPVEKKLVLKKKKKRPPEGGC